MDEHTRTRRPRADDPAEPREEGVAERRRRRDDNVFTDPTLKRFGIPPGVLDMEKYAYRAAVDGGNRLHDLTVDDDYDFVSLKGHQTTKDAEGVARYRSGTVDGAPQYTYLLAKLKKFADEDRAKAVRKVDAEEKARLTARPDDAPDQSYTPNKGK